MNDSLSYSVAVIADIHGNVAALNAVLEDLLIVHATPTDVAGFLGFQRPLHSLRSFNPSDTLPTLCYDNIRHRKTLHEPPP